MQELNLYLLLDLFRQGYITGFFIVLIVNTYYRWRCILACKQFNKERAQESVDTVVEGIDKMKNSTNSFIAYVVTAIIVIVVSAVEGLFWWALPVANTKFVWTVISGKIFKE